MFIRNYDRFIKQKLPLPFLYKALRYVFSLVLIPFVLVIIIKLVFLDIAPVTKNSMAPTINSGDYVLFTKLIPGPRNLIASKRYPGLREIKRGDIMIFNDPESDTVIVELPGVNYYVSKRIDYEKTKEFKIDYQALNKRKRIIKRFVGLPGDTIYCSRGNLFINNQAVDYSVKHNYFVYTDGENITDNTLSLASISYDDYQRAAVSNFEFVLALSEEQINILKKDIHVKFITRIEYPQKLPFYSVVFPYDKEYHWTLDNFGKIIVPKKNKCIKLTPSNLVLYRRVIELYEGNHVRIVNGDVYLNGIWQETYCFEMDYYWVLGDNWHQSVDSRYFGFVPEDHVIGKVLTVFLSKK